MHRTVIGLLIGGILLSGCKQKSPSNPSPTVTGIVVSGSATFSTKNQTSQLTATANFSNGNTQNVSNSATWSSGNPAVASVSSTGVVTSVSAGSSTITANYQGQSGSLPVSVTLSAEPRVTADFFRLCGPFRGRIEVTFAETKGDIGYNVTALTLTMRDINGIIRNTRVYSVADLNAALSGSNHLNAGQTKILIHEASYPGNVDTMDSTAVVQASVTDDSGNSQSITVNITFQRDRC